MRKYKQTEIPRVKTGIIYNNRNAVKCYYNEHLQGKIVTNRHLNILLRFTSKGKGKVSQGGALYSKKVAILQCLYKLAEVAEFNNFGNRKSKDSQLIKGYLNFKGKVFIDGKLENVRLSFIVQDDGKFYYNHEVSIIK